MNDVKLPEAPLPPDLRARTLGAYDELRPRRAFRLNWKWVVAATALCAASVGAFERPTTPAPFRIIPLSDGNRLAIGTVFAPASLHEWLMLIHFTLDTPNAPGDFTQTVRARPVTGIGMRDMTYSMSPVVRPDHSYDLNFTGLMDRNAHVALGETYKLRLFRMAWHTCFTVLPPKADPPPCTASQN